MPSLLPDFSGKLSVDTLPPDFFDRLESRAAEGWLRRGYRHRSNYVVRRKGQDFIEIDAADFSTAISVGLNEMKISRENAQTLAYEVRFWRWTGWSTMLCGGIAAALLVAYMTVPQLMDQVDEYPFGRMFFWGMIFFWGALWPWLLTAMHKPVARRLLERILREEATGAVEAAPEGAVPIPPVAAGKCYRYQSETQVWGMPLLSVAIGPNPTTGEMRGHARGIVAVGDTARGVFAMGGVAVGVFSMGGVSVGLLTSFGGLSLGGLAIGGAAFGAIAVGGLAVGIVAVGGAALGFHAFGGGAVTFPELLRYFSQGR